MRIREVEAAGSAVCIDYISQRAPGAARGCWASFLALFCQSRHSSFPELPDKESGWPRQNVNLSTLQSSGGWRRRPCEWWEPWLRTRGEGCGAGPRAAASSCEAGWWVAMWLRRRGLGVPSASEGDASSAAWTEMGSWVRTICGRLKQRLDVGREICRQYPLFCFLLLCLSVASLLLNRYLPLAPRRPLESPQTAGRRAGAHSAPPSRQGRPRLRPDMRTGAGPGPRSLRGYLALNLSFLTISQLRAFIICFTTAICNTTTVRDRKGDRREEASGFCRSLPSWGSLLSQQYALTPAHTFATTISSL